MKSRKCLQILALVLLAVFTLTGCSSVPSLVLTGGVLPAQLFSSAETPDPDQTNADEAAAEQTVIQLGDEPAEMTGLSITMLDVGQGLGLVIQADGYTMLYDGGPAPDENAADQTYPVIAWLEDHKVESIGLMIASHYDTDHISGLIEVLGNYPVKTVLAGDYNDNTKVCEAFHKQLKNTEAVMSHPKVGEIYTLGNLQIEILSPLNYEYEEKNDTVPEDETKTENDCSIAVRLTYGDFHCVITGDAQATAEKDMLAGGADLSADLYVAGHHGSYTSSSAEFVDAVSPEYAFISCGKDNEYGQPAEKTLETLKAAGVLIFRTDTQGAVTCTSDGKTFEFDQKPTDNWEPGATVSDSSASASSVLAAGAAAVASESAADTESYAYILNTNTMKIHHTWCDSVNDMSEKNKQGTNASLDELESLGYVPCKRCF